MEYNGEAKPYFEISEADMPDVIKSIDNFDVANREYIESIALLKLKESRCNLKEVDVSETLLVMSFRTAIAQISDSEPDLENRSLQIATMLKDKYLKRAVSLNLLTGCECEVDFVENMQQITYLAEEIYYEMLDVDNPELITEVTTESFTETFINDLLFERDHFVFHLEPKKIDKIMDFAGSVGYHILGLCKVVIGTSSI